MEVSSLFVNGFHPVLAAQPTTFASRFPYPPPHSAGAKSVKVSQSHFAAPAISTELGVQSQNGQRSDSATTSSSHYRARQSAVRDIQQSPHLASALARSGDMLKAQDMNVILRHFGKLNKWKELSEIFNWMQLNGKTNFASYSSYFKFAGKKLNPLEALEVYKSIKDEPTRINTSVCNSILSCLVKSGKFESTLELFNQMKRVGLVPDIVTYSTLLVGCAKFKGGYSKALEIIQELKYNGLHMDGVIYGSLIAVCASHNKREEAEKYFNEMKNEGHSPNVFHYSSLLNAYSADGDYKKADELVQEMKSSGLVLNKVILTTLLKVYVKGGLFDRSRELLKELEDLGYAEEEMPYCLLMDGLAKAGQVHKAKSIFDHMKQKQVKTDGYSHSIMISAFCRCGLLEDAKKLACDFEAASGKYDVVFMNAMLSAYCRAGEMDNVMKTMKKMDESSISPDWNTFRILIKYFCREKLYLLAHRTMEDMHRKGYQPEEGLCSLLIYHLGKSGAHSEAFSVYNMLKYRKRNICRSLHEKVLHILIAGGLLKDAYVVVKDNAGSISRPVMKRFAISFMKSGNLNLMNDVIKAIHSSGYKIDKELFHMAISRYIEQPEKKELLIQLLQWMPGQGYVADSSTRTLLVRNSHLFGRELIAHLLSKQHMMSKTNRYPETKEK